MPAITFFVMAVLLPIIALIAWDLIGRFWIPRYVMVLDSGAVLRYKTGRTKRITWEDVRPPFNVRRLGTGLRKVDIEAIQLSTGGGRVVLYVDANIGRALESSYEAWSSRRGWPGEIVEKRFPLDRIIAGEGSKAYGYAWIALGVALASVMMVLAFVLAGVSNIVFDFWVIVVAVSVAGMASLFGLAEIRSQAKYILHGMLAGYIPLTSVLVLLVIGTMDQTFLILLVIIAMFGPLNYILVWWKISKAERGDSPNAPEPKGA
ncbi:MAG: hypothetical protein LN417_08085 [Candidatus Thermoplasmatota archaeon]|nr:hypothetical protein [Candidatus Thermoplasmatota archaeon]